MAGIEKVCEYSGNTPGFLMYEYKRNRIQIEPEFRKLFKNEPFKFFRFLPDYNMCNWKGHPMTDYCLYVPNLPGRVNGFYYNWTYNKLGIVRRKLQKLMGVGDLNEIRIPLTIGEAYTSADNTKMSLGGFLLFAEHFNESNWTAVINEVTP